MMYIEHALIEGKSKMNDTPIEASYRIFKDIRGKTLFKDTGPIPIQYQKIRGMRVIGINFKVENNAFVIEVLLD